MIILRIIKRIALDVLNVVGIVTLILTSLSACVAAMTLLAGLIGCVAFWLFPSLGAIPDFFSTAAFGLLIFGMGVFGSVAFTLIVQGTIGSYRYLKKVYREAKS